MNSGVASGRAGGQHSYYGQISPLSQIFLGYGGYFLKLPKHFLKLAKHFLTCPNISF